MRPNLPLLLSTDDDPRARERRKMGKSHMKRELSAKGPLKGENPGPFDVDVRDLGEDGSNVLLSQAMLCKELCRSFSERTGDTGYDEQRLIRPAIWTLRFRASNRSNGRCKHSTVIRVMSDRHAKILISREVTL
jgi:hypothetical protein